MSSSSSSSPSSSSSSPSSSSSSSISCPNQCLWEKDDLGIWSQKCHGCAEGYVCYEPGVYPVVARKVFSGDLEPTDCVPDPVPFPSSTSGGAATFSARLAVAPPTAVGRVRLPSVFDPKVWKTTGVDLSQPWHVTQLPLIGWSVTFLQVPAGPASPLVTPAHLPTDVLASGNRSLIASVILPEGGGFNHYWVPVLEKYRWARLDTAAWTVLFLRLPMAICP